jgi:molybdenum cofactor cytidylyltransferase
MGGLKQLKTWRSAGGEKPLLAAAYDAIQPICNEMVVVLGHEAEVVAAALGDRTFQPALSTPDRPMFESILAGLRKAGSLDAAANVVLQPGDHPEVARATLATLVEQLQLRPGQAIIPEYAGRGGHPALIPPNVVRLIVESECPHGLAQFWSEHPEMCHRVPVDDPSMLLDIDTPADLPQ